MIEIVLRYSNKLRIRSVRSLWDQWLVQTLSRKAPYGMSEIFVQLFQHTDGITLILCARPGHRGPVLELCQLASISGEPPQDQAICATQMQNQLPDTVCASDRMRCCFLRRNSFEGFENGRAMPRLTLKCSPQLLFQPA